MIDLIIDVLMELLPEVFMGRVVQWYHGLLQRIPWAPLRLFVLLLLLLLALLAGIALLLLILAGLILLAKSLGLF